MFKKLLALSISLVVLTTTLKAIDDQRVYRERGIVAGTATEATDIGSDVLHGFFGGKSRSERRQYREGRYDDEADYNERSMRNYRSPRQMNNYEYQREEVEYTR